MLVEDHILIRLGIATVSQLEPDIELVGEVEEGEEAVVCYRKCKPDVVLVDMRLPGMDGVETIQALQHEFGSVVALVLSEASSARGLLAAARGGWSGRRG